MHQSSSIRVASGQAQWPGVGGRPKWQLLPSIGAPRTGPQLLLRTRRPRSPQGAGRGLRGSARAGSRLGRRLPPPAGPGGQALLLAGLRGGGAGAPARLRNGAGGRAWLRG